MTFRLHDLAVLRAVTQGVTPEAAVDRYVPDAHADARVCRSHVHRLAVDVCALVAARGDPHGAQALRTCLTPSAEASSEQQLPSLAEFAEEINGEDLSERELQALYDERFATGHRTKHRQHQQTLALAELVRVQQDAVVHPAPNDPLLGWFKPSLAKPIQAALAVVTLQELADAIGSLGPTWHRVVPGVGRARAHRISQWLSAMSVGSPQPTAIAAVQHAGIGQWPAAMLTASRQPPEQGMLRTTGPNALGTFSDTEAMRVWLGTLGFRSALTRRAYARDVERLLMWA